MPRLRVPPALTGMRGQGHRHPCRCVAHRGCATCAQTILQLEAHHVARRRRPGDRKTKTDKHDRKAKKDKHDGKEQKLRKKDKERRKRKDRE